MLLLLFYLFKLSIRKRQMLA